MNTNDIFLPAAKSTIASEVDALFSFVFIASILFFVLVIGGALYFIIRYRRRKGDGYTPDYSHNTKLEVVWTVIPTILVFVIFFWSFKTYLKMQVAPKDAIQIKATGQKWFWQFDYPEGASSTGELIVPRGKPVQVLLSSRDVIHSFYVPNFRVKMDALPNRYTMAWFEATETGEYDLFCAEYCGTGHSKMLAKVRVVEPEEYQQWLQSNNSLPEGMAMDQYGAQLYKTKACVTCHTNDGAPGTGPSFLGLFGRTENLQDGSTVTVDENYLRESILNPQAKVVHGFQPVMPTYTGILKDKEIDALVMYIKSLKKE